MRWRYLKWSIGFWLGGGWLVVGSILAVIAFFLWARYERNKDDFYAARGTITDKYNKGKRHDDWLTVRYLAKDGNAHKTDVAIQPRDATDYKIGGEVDLYVAGKNADDAWLQRSGPPTPLAAEILTGIGGVFALAGAAIFFSAFSRALARASTVESGQPMQGKIVDVEFSNWRVNNVAYSAYRYVWTGIDGVEHEGVSLPFHPRHAKLAAGDAVTVYVDPTAPGRGEIRLD